MGTIANAKVTHYYNCYNGDFIGCLPFNFSQAFMFLWNTVCFSKQNCLFLWHE